MLELEIPWPPSSNRYWRNIRGRTIVSKEARLYKFNIKELIFFIYKIKTPYFGKLELEISAFPPDKRQRDLDNLLKVTLDSLQSGKLFLNDYQIDKIFIERKEVVKNGKLAIKIREIN